MSPKQRLTLLSLGASVAASCIALAPSSGHAADLGATPRLSYDLAAAGLTAPQDDTIETDVGDSDATAAAPSATAAIDPAALECMAKVVLHESGHEPRAGQVAVAQTVVNRLKAGRFGNSVCAVVGQRGQFFNVASYNPNRDSAAWTAAVEVARAVLSGDADPVVPGAMFFRAASSTSSAFFRSRERVATVGAQIFYR